MSEELGGNMKCTCTEVDEYGWHDEDCLLIKDKINLIDLDKIEEELTQIKRWPWKVIEIKILSPRVAVGDARGSPVLDSSIPECLFIAKAPERIAALVKRVKVLEEALKCIREGDLHNFSDPSQCMKEYADEILRGSDEV